MSRHLGTHLIVHFPLFILPIEAAQIGARYTEPHNAALPPHIPMYFHFTGQKLSTQRCNPQPLYTNRH
jgi:hypothetical protein